MQRLRGAIVESPELLPGGLAVAVLIAWAVGGGGSSVAAQGAGGIFLLALALGTGCIYRHRLRTQSRLVLGALGLGGGFVLWSFLSITWADVPADAWEGANRALIYFSAFALFAVPPWSARSGLAVMGLWAVGCAIGGIIAVAHAAGAPEAIVSFVARRFADPTGYHNANAALYAAAFFPALIVAARSETPALLRGVALAAAQALFLLALLPQSRGWLVAFPVVVLLTLALAPSRARLIVLLAALGGGSALAAGPILDVYPAASENRGLDQALENAGKAILLASASMFVAGFALGLADRRVARSHELARRARQAVGGAALAAAAAGIAVALSVIGNPLQWGTDRWDDFKSGEPDQGFAGSRLGGALGSNRYDFWRVALDEGLDQPLIGLGIENFAVAYVRERESDEEPLHPHSLPVKIVSQTGLVGTFLFGGFLLCGGLAALRAATRGTVLRRAAAVAAIASFGYWFIHGSADWFWAFAGLSTPALAWLGLAASLQPRRPLTSESVEGLKLNRRRGGPIAAASAALVLLAGAASLGLPALAARDVDAAATSWGADPHAAYQRLDRAERMNFLSARPALVEGAIASRLRDYERMRAAFSRALEREPQSWYAHLELGALGALEGDGAGARMHLGRASRLNPRDPTVALVLRRAEARRPMPLARIDASFLKRVCVRLGATRATEYCR